MFEQVFQSSPAINCGRHRSISTLRPKLRKFQSSPAINCGRHQRNLFSLLRIICFNPHPRSTAGVTCYGGLYTITRICFNPHPRSTAGVTLLKPPISGCCAVSILTRDQLRASRLKRKRLKQKGFYPILREPPKRWFVFHTFFHTPKISPTNSITYTCANL